MMLKVSVRNGRKTLTTSVTITNGDNKKTIRFGALEHNYKLSPSGKYFYIHLANSKSPDAGKFIKLNTETLERVFTINPEWGVANEYLFSPNSDTLLVKLNFGAYAIDDEGVIINRSDYYMDIVKFASLSSIDSLPTFFVLHDKNEINYQIALNSMDKVLKCCGTMFHGLSWGAIALKAKAVVLGDMGRVEDALQCCVDAIAIDPKVTAKQMRNNFCRQLKIEKDNIAPSEWVSDFKKSVEKIRADELIKIGENYKQLNARQEFLARKDQVKHEKSHLSSENKKAMLWVAALLIVIFIIWMSQ